MSDQDQAYFFIKDGQVFIEADGARRWLELADPKVAAEWDRMIDHLVRTGMESQTKKPWWSL